MPLAWRPLFGWWLASRALVLGTAFVVHLLGRPHGFFNGAVRREPLGLLQIWDGAWYARVAEHGYLLVPGHQSDPAFFPLYPILIEGLEQLGLSPPAAGVLLSNVVFLVAVLAVYELGRELVPEPVAYRGAVAVAVFPLGFVFSMVYPEALVLAAIALAGVLALRGRWLGAAAAAAVAALARPEGALVAIPLAAAVLTRRRHLEPEQLGRPVAAVLAGPVALVSFPLYLGWALHNPFAWQRAQTAWGRSFRTDGLYRAFADFPAAAHRHPWLYRDLVFLAIYLALLALATRAGVPRAWLAMAALVVLLPLGSGSVESDGRFGLLAPPVYWGLASLGTQRAAWRLLLAMSLVLLVAGTVTLKLAFP